MTNEAQAHEYYFNVATGEIEQGKVSDWTNRLGPYATREEAAAALEKIQARNEAWDADDDKWNT